MSRYLSDIEELLGEARLVDGAAAIFARLRRRAPGFAPERRRFLACAARAAAGAWVCALDPTGARAQGEPAPPVTEFRGKRFTGWQAYLLGQDQIFGPPLTIDGFGGRAKDFEHHVALSNGLGGAVDFAVPAGIPLVPGRPGFLRLPRDQREGTEQPEGPIRHLSLFHDGGRSATRYGPLETRFRPEQMDGSTVVNFTSVIGRSDPAPGKRPHLRYGVFRRARFHNNEGSQFGFKDWQSPGIDPFETGIYQGRPVYYDGAATIKDRFTKFGTRVEMERFAAELAAGRPEELGLERSAYAALEQLIDERDSGPLERHLSRAVFVERRHLPGSFMYATALRFVRNPDHVATPADADSPDGIPIVTMLPFIHPLVVERYQAANPEFEL